MRVIISCLFTSVFIATVSFTAFRQFYHPPPSFDALLALFNPCNVMQEKDRFEVENIIGHKCPRR